MPDVTVLYKGQNILELNDSGYASIHTAGKYCEDNINLRYVNPGGGGNRPDPENAVRFFDYDGTLLHSYTADQFEQLEQMPANPTHSGLTAQGWNWSLEDAKTQLHMYDMVDIGQTYTTSDGKTRLVVELEAGRLTPYLGLGILGSVDIDWGDGTSHSNVVGNTVSNLFYGIHTYSAPGRYTIVLSVTGSARIFGASAGESWTYLLRSTDIFSDNNYSDNVYRGALKEVYIGDNIDIGNLAFCQCPSLQSLTLPNSITSLGQGVFKSCYALTCVIFPSSVTTLGSTTFGSCGCLDVVSIPASVSVIPANMFDWCYRIRRVVLPFSVTQLGDGLFSSCYCLTTVNIPVTATAIPRSMFSSCSALTDVLIPPNVTEIGMYAFSSCHSLREPRIPNTVTTIGASAFYKCYGLGQLTVPSSVTSIGQSAFSSAHALMELNAQLTEIQKETFTYFWGNDSISVPSTVTSIGAQAFSYSMFREIQLPEGLVSIANSVFVRCRQLSHIVIPSTVQSIGDYVFYECAGLGMVKFAGAVPPTIGSRTWDSTNDTFVVLFPYASTIEYRSKGGYPLKTKHPYLGFYSSSSGEVLPTSVTDGTTLYNLTWYATIDDAVAGTDPITEMVGDEVYCTSVLVSEE